LPQQVVGDPQFAAGPDQEVRVVHLGRIQPPAKVLLGGAIEGGGRVHDLGPAAIVEGDEEPDPIVVRGQSLGPLHALDQLGVDLIAATDEPHPHALVVELRRLAVDSLPEHPHQALDLARRAGPVLG
jgi:hypothetical protein